MKKRVVIAGFGDTGLLVAINLGSDFDIVGISPKHCLVSRQELGMRLTQPQVWKQDYLMPFGRYKKLQGVRTLQGLITAMDPVQASVTVRVIMWSFSRRSSAAVRRRFAVPSGLWTASVIAPAPPRRCGSWGRYRR